MTPTPSSQSGDSALQSLQEVAMDAEHAAPMEQKTGGRLKHASIAFNLATVMAAYLAIARGNVIATNWIYFTCAVGGLFGLAMLFCPKPELRKILSRADPKTPEWFSHLCDGIVLFGLVAGGWWYCAAAQTLHWWACAYLYGLRKEGVEA